MVGSKVNRKVVAPEVDWGSSIMEGLTRLRGTGTGQRSTKGHKGQPRSRQRWTIVGGEGGGGGGGVGWEGLAKVQPSPLEVNQADQRSTQVNRGKKKTTW